MEDTQGNAVPVLETDDLDRKALQAFPGKVVRKDLTALMRRGANVPTFVLEYLLGMYCSTDDEESVAEGLDRIRRILAQNYVRPDESERIKSKVRDLRSYMIIDKVAAKVDEYRDIHTATFSNLAIDPMVMPDEYVREYPKMLTGSMWCIAQMEYFRLEDELEDELSDVFGGPKKPRQTMRRGVGPEDNPFKIANLTPIQMPRLDLDSIVGQRANFTTDEWIEDRKSVV